MFVFLLEGCETAERRNESTQRGYSSMKPFQVKKHADTSVAALLASLLVPKMVLTYLS